MTLTIAEWFGYSPSDASSAASRFRAESLCPFLQKRCNKVFNDRTVSGVCSVLPGRASASPIPICPNRMYAGHFAVLNKVSEIAFGAGHQVTLLSEYQPDAGVGAVVAIAELRLPSRDRHGSYFVDWILARVSPSGGLAEFTAVEVQTIDTTGSYRPEVEELRQGHWPGGKSKAGLNWENVSKRILPQLIYKGHVLQREPLCTKGLFFICPSEVHERIRVRIGGRLEAYGLQHGAITFLWYGLDPSAVGNLRPLSYRGQFSTTVEQVAFSFVAPADLPPAGSYESVIRSQLQIYD